MATTNKMRALNRLPYDFEDGLKVGGVDVTSLNQAFTPAGAGLIGFTPVGNLAAGNVQAALAELESEKVGFARLDDTDGSSLVGYTPSGTGAVPTTVQSKLRESVSVTDRGADPTGTANSSAAIIAALSDASHVIVPPGTYRCDTMIELNSGKTLELMGGATLKRFSANSVSTDPVVWIKGQGASLIGSGQAVSIVKTENRSPKGVVRLGHKDMTESHGNVNYCTLKDMTIAGQMASGQTTGDPDVALYMPNPQFGNLTSYYHNIFGLKVQDANFGIWLHGWANANTISNIQGYRLGNTTLGVNKNAFIYCNGALDNVVSTCFFTSSTNSIGTLVDKFDNTANGGLVHTCFANSFVNIAYEQGGASAYGVRLLSGSRNLFIVRDNVALANSLLEANNFVLGVSNNLSPAILNATDYVKSATYVEATSDFRTSGSYKSVDSDAR